LLLPMDVLIAKLLVFRSVGVSEVLVGVSEVLVGVSEVLEQRLT
jgi:hypothetical protein